MTSRRPDIWPLKVFAYDGIEIFWLVSDSRFVFFEGVDAMNTEMSADTATRARECLRYHKELRDKYFDVYGKQGQLGVATPKEEEKFWELFDDLVERLRRELDPTKYEIVEVGPPEPNPFVWESRRK